MGNICLVDDKLATLYIPLFVQELEKSDCAAVLNNILVVMADFCVRYTALVDCGKDEKARSQRMDIYVSFLKQMAPEHLLATSAKLFAEILADASDGLLSIDDVTGQPVVRACREMRLQSSKASDTAEMDDESGDCGAAAGATLLAATGRVVTQVANKNLIQHAVPIFIELKRLLESKNSPLMGSLRVFLKDYQNEIDEILVADKQLHKELIYDMEKYEAAKAKSTVAEAISNAQQNQSVVSGRG